MKFLKLEWTRKRGAIALLATSLVVTSFILGGYVATGNWNPWGNRHYYQALNANFQECYTPVGGATQCQSMHNVMFNTGALYVEQVVEKGAATPALCAIGAACSFNFIAMSSTTTAPTAAMSSTGTTTATTSGDCGVAGGTGGQNGAELTTSGFAAAAGTVTDITGGTGAQSTIVKTFTATAITTVAQSCLVNQAANGSANRVNLAAQTFTAITLQISDTIQITWTITWNWS
jgi:hypothetical protein